MSNGFHISLFVSWPWVFWVIFCLVSGSVFGSVRFSSPLVVSQYFCCILSSLCVPLQWQNVCSTSDSSKWRMGRHVSAQGAGKEWVFCSRTPRHMDTVGNVVLRSHSGPKSADLPLHHSCPYTPTCLHFVISPPVLIQEYSSYTSWSFQFIRFSLQ